MNTLFNYSSLLAPYGIYAALASTLGSSTTSLLSVSSAPTQTDAFQTEISAYGQLLSSLANFQYALQQLIPPYQDNTLNATSANASVASASASSGAQAANYTLSVSNLAQAETVESSAFSDPSSTVLGSGTLTIQTGTYQSGNNLFTSDGSAAVHVTINNGTLNSIATAINASGAGVVASVQQNTDGYHLAIARNITGSLKNFQITVNDSDGNNTNLSGLSLLAFDPTAAVGGGQNLSLAQAGEDAAYAVNGVGATSSSNSGISLASNLSANLLSTGSTSIEVNVNYDNLTSAVQSLMSAFNTVQGSINGEIGQGQPLQNDTLTSMLVADLNQQAQQTLNNGSSSFESLNQVGLRYQSPEITGQGGTLTLDTDLLQAAYALDPSGTANLVSISAQGFNTLSNAYTTPGFGTLPQTINELQKVDFSQRMQIGSPTSLESIPSNLSSLLQQESNGTSGSATLFTAQQISALSQYASILALGEPYAVDALLIGSIGPIGPATPPSFSIFA